MTSRYKGMQMYKERRLADRRELAVLCVSIARKRARYDDSDWYPCEIWDVSTKGIRLICAASYVFDVGAEVELLCFPDNEATYLGQGGIACHITGRVVWRDDENKHLGIEFTS
jgi:hypothetical protein